MSRAFGSAFTVTGLVLLSCLPLAAQEPTTVHRTGGFDISVSGDVKGFPGKVPRETNDCTHIAYDLAVMSALLQESPPASEIAPVGA